MMIENMENRILLTAHVQGSTLVVNMAVAATVQGTPFTYTISKAGNDYHVMTDADGFNALFSGNGITGISVTGQDLSADFVIIQSSVTIPATITTGLGNDQVSVLGSGPATVILGPTALGNGQTDDDTFQGGSGNDSVLGGAGSDFIFGGAGDDTLLGEGGGDTLSGDAGNDLLLGDSLRGGGGAGTAGADSLLGGDDNDTIEGDGGNDTIDAGLGVNTLSYADHTSAVLVIFGSAQSGTGQILPPTAPTPGPSWSEQDSIVDWDFISVVWGGSGADSIDASLSNHVVELDGFAGNDLLIGSDVSDPIIKMGDTIDGGDDQDVILAGGGDDTVMGGLGADNIQGGDGNDMLFGGTGNQDFTTIDGNDVINGGTGNDSIDGESGDDLEIGGLGNDWFLAGPDFYTIAGVQVSTGRDTMQGDLGLDTVDYTDRQSPVNVSIDLVQDDGNPSENAPIGEQDFVTETTEKVLGTNGNDTMTSPAGISVWFVGNGGNDCLVGGSAADTLEGDGGNDTLTGGLGSDSIIGGPGSDTASYADHVAGVLVTMDFGAEDDGALAEGDDVFGVETVIGGSGDDTLVGTANADCLIGGLGNDSLVGLAGNDTLIGGDFAANTTVTGSTGADTFDGGAGIDVVDFSLIKANLTISLDNVANDGITNGAQGADIMDDCEVVLGGSGSDTMTASANGDCLVGNGGNDSLIGGAGDDTLVGGAGGDIILGGLGNDSLLGGDGQDILQGNDGNDSLLGGTGSDQMFGGAGNDWVSYNYETRAVSVTLDGIPNDGPAGENDLVNSDVENIEGGKGNDILVGNNSANQINGGPGNDSLVGLQGNDTLHGEAGSDTMNGGYNNDTMVGGPGGDRFIGGKGVADAADYSSSTVAVFLSLDNKANDGAKGEFDQIDSDVEILIGGTGNDSLVGSGANNTLIGNDGDDTLIGGFGADSLVGGNGNDLLVSSNRKLQNDLANDILDGGNGTDSVIRDGSDAIFNIP